MSEFARRPGTDEYNQYYGTYVNAVPDGDVLEGLRSQLERGLATWCDLPQGQRDHRYAEGKWSLRQVLGHVVDTERIFAYRALCIARGDLTPLPGMDQDHYMQGSDFEHRSWSSLVDEYRHQRLANLALFGSFDGSVLARRGTASGFPVTARALVWIVAGHELHHLRIVAERYLA